MNDAPSSSHRSDSRAPPQHGIALKYARAGEHQLAVDPRSHPGHWAALTIKPEEESNLVGADVMDEITLGWGDVPEGRIPASSVTMEARASGPGAWVLTGGRAHLGPGRTRVVAAEDKGFVDKFGYSRCDQGGDGSVGRWGRRRPPSSSSTKTIPWSGLTTGATRRHLFEDAAARVR